MILEATEELRWRVLARSEVEPGLKENEAISFVPFHLLGFGPPMHPLLRWLLYYYRLCLHDLTLEGILYLSVFIMLCEGFLGIPTHYDLWQILFWVVMSACSWHRRCLMGGTSIEVCPRLEERYLSLDHHYAADLDWEHRWLYVPNNERPSLPTFSQDRLCPDMPESWSGPPTLSEPQHLCLLLDAIEDLKDRGLTAPRVIHTFFSHWVLPLKMRATPIGSSSTQRTLQSSRASPSTWRR